MKIKKNCLKPKWPPLRWSALPTCRSTDGSQDWPPLTIDLSESFTRLKGFLNFQVVKNPWLLVALLITIFKFVTIPRLYILVFVFTILQLSQLSHFSEFPGFLWLWSWSSQFPGFLSTWSTSSLILESTRNWGWTSFVCLILFSNSYFITFSFYVNIDRNLFKILFLGFPSEMWQAGRAYIQNSPKKFGKKCHRKVKNLLIKNLLLNNNHLVRGVFAGAHLFALSSSVSNPVIYGFFNSVRLQIVVAVFSARKSSSWIRGNFQQNSL